MHIRVTDVNNKNDSFCPKQVTIQSPIRTFNNHLLLSLYVPGLLLSSGYNPRSKTDTVHVFSKLTF